MQSFFFYRATNIQTVQNSTTLDKTHQHFLFTKYLHKLDKTFTIQNKSFYNTIHHMKQFYKLHNTYPNLTTLYTTIHNSTKKVYNILKAIQNYTSRHSATVCNTLFNLATLYRHRQYFTRLHKALQHSNHIKTSQLFTQLYRTLDNFYTTL